MNSWEFLVVGLWQLRIPIAALVGALALGIFTGKLKLAIFLPLAAVTFWAVARASILGWNEPGFHARELTFYILGAALFAVASAFLPVVIGAFAGRAWARWRKPAIKESQQASM